MNSFEVNRDYLIWEDFISTHKNQSIDLLQNLILNSKNSALAYFFAYTYKYKQYLCQKLIIDNKDVKYAYLFATTINGCNLPALEDLIVKSKNLKYITKFLLFKPSKTLEKLLFDSKNLKYIIMYLNHNNKSLLKFKNLILNSNQPNYIFELSKHVKYKKDITIIEDLLISLKSSFYIRMLAKNKFSNLEKLENAIISLNDVEEIKKFAKTVKKSNLKYFLL